MTNRQRILGQYIGLVLQDKAMGKLSAIERLRRARQLLEADFRAVWELVGKEALKRIVGRALDGVL